MHTSSTFSIMGFSVCDVSFSSRHVLFLFSLLQHFKQSGPRYRSSYFVYNFLWNIYDCCPRCPQSLFFLQQPKSPKKQTTRFYFQLWKLCNSPAFFLSHKNNQMCRLFHCKTFSIWGERHAQQTMTYATSCCNLWAMLPGLIELLFVSLQKYLRRKPFGGKKNGNSDGWYAIYNVWHECKV